MHAMSLRFALTGGDYCGWQYAYGNAIGLFLQHSQQWFQLGLPLGAATARGASDAVVA